jgi:ABC-type sugar transport systems, ATPase components
MAVLSIRNIVKSFGKTDVLRDVSLEVADREFLVLLGPSGCGKSTLLRIIAGLTDATSGSIHHGDERIDLLAARDRNIAFVFQSYALYPHMTVRRNIAFPVVMQQFKWFHHFPIVGGLWRRALERRPEVAGQVDRVAGMLELDKVINRRPATLSGGQRQRVALARAMVRQPSIYLMDEPLSNLDARLRAQTRAEIMALYQREQKTVIYVTHDQVEAMTMGSRIAVMRDGVIQQIGTPEEVYSLPDNVFVAGFLGSPPMNLIKGALRAGSVVVAGSTTIAPSADQAELVAALPDDTGITVGIRPEHLSLAAPDDPGVRAVGTVSQVEYLGGERILTVDLSGDAGTDSLVRHGASLQVRAPESTALVVGDPVGVRFEAKHVLMFDTESGMRIGAGVAATSTAEAA